MFGHKFEDFSDISVEIKIRQGAGHPVTAWEGSPKTPDHEVIGDISRSVHVIKYVKKAISKGKLKEDDMGNVEVPAFLCVKQGKDQTEEHQIKFVLPLPGADSDPADISLLLIEKIASILANTFQKLNDESQKSLQATVNNLAKIIEAANSGTKDAMKHESERADAAHKAIIDLLTNNAANANKTDWVDDFVKIIGTGPALIAFIERLIDKLPKGAK